MELNTTHDKVILGHESVFCIYPSSPKLTSTCLKSGTGISVTSVGQSRSEPVYLSEYIRNNFHE